MLIAFLACSVQSNHVFKSLATPTADTPVQLMDVNFQLQSNGTFKCVDRDKSCNGNGRCSTVTDDCVCDKNYATFQPPKGTQCEYERKSSVAVICLQTFLGPTGAAFFYLGRSTLATIQCCMFFAPLGLACFACCFAGVASVSGLKEQATAGIGAVLVVLMGINYLSLIVWSFVNWIYVLMINYVDGNGIYPTRI